MTKETPVKKLSIDDPVTYTSPLDDEELPGVVEGLEADERPESGGGQTTVDIYLVRLAGGGLLRCERAWLTERKEP